MLTPIPTPIPTPTPTPTPRYTTITLPYSGSVTTTTTVPPGGTAAGTVIVQIPVSSVTTTAAYGGSATKTTTIPPSGAPPGTVIVQTPLPTLNYDPSGYLIQVTALYRIDITSGASTLVSNPVGSGASINAMGYNIADNFLYAASGDSPGNLIRITGDGSSTIITPLNLTTSCNSGDVDEQSQYWATASGKYWVQVDLKPGSPTYAKLKDTGTAMSLNSIIDWAYVPGGGNNLYGLAYSPPPPPSPAGQTILMAFDRQYHNWTTLTNFGSIAKNTWGAVYASDNGYLYGSDNLSGEIWRFPLPSKGITPLKISQGPKSTSNDGARCIKAQNIT